MMECKAVFELSQKSHLQIYAVINYSTPICPFESGKCGKGKNNFFFEYLENEKRFLDEIKKHFS